MTFPQVVIPDVPPLLSPEEFALKQAAEQTATNPPVPVGLDPFELQAPDAVATIEAVTGDDAEPVERDDDGPVPGLPDVPPELQGLDAAGLVQASDTIGELLAAMLLAAKLNADTALADQIESLGKSMAHMVSALESVRLMIGDTDTADTLGPVAVTVVDYLTAEILAWLTGSRPATGTEHALPVS